jgi:hypothetical protein
MAVIECDSPIPPRREDDLLAQDDLPDWWNTASLNITSWGGDEHVYTEGYRRGARLLVEHVIEQRRDQNYLVFPIVFLYRHHIELALKSIIARTPYLLNRPLSTTEQEHLGRHRLDLLWQDLKPMFIAICEAAGWDKLASADEEGVDSYIRQLTALDPNSYSFRYTRSKEGSPSLPKDLTHINLRHFAEMLDRLADYLDGLDTALSVLEDGKAEMESEWRSDMASYGG